MLSQLKIQSVVDKISYKDWKFHLLSKGDGYLLQVMFSSKDSSTLEWTAWKGRKWYISSHACEGEIVRTAYKAVEAAELHEMQENFKYFDEAIFDPHLNPLHLANSLYNKTIGKSVREPRR